VFGKEDPVVFEEELDEGSGWNEIPIAEVIETEGRLGTSHFEVGERVRLWEFVHGCPPTWNVKCFESRLTGEWPVRKSVVPFLEREKRRWFFEPRIPEDEAVIVDFVDRNCVTVQFVKSGKVLDRVPLSVLVHQGVERNDLFFNPGTQVLFPWNGIVQRAVVVDRHPGPRFDISLLESGEIVQNIPSSDLGVAVYHYDGMCGPVMTPFQLKWQNLAVYSFVALLPVGIAKLLLTKPPFQAVLFTLMYFSFIGAVEKLLPMERRHEFSRLLVGCVYVTWAFIMVH